MINIAIVEDSDIDANRLMEYLDAFKTNNQSFEYTVERFTDGSVFLNNYRDIFDVIFMDIEMPNVNGMETAIKLRKFDRQVVLIFVTNMAQFAVKGYEVDAMDFVIKPVSYHDFSSKMQKAIKIVNSNTQAELVISQSSGITRVATKEIFYIEVVGHKLSYHTESEEINGYGTLTELEEKLKAFHFMRCNNCYLVNPKHIFNIKGYDIVMRNGDVLQISHPRKKKFMTEMSEWLGQGNFI